MIWAKNKVLNSWDLMSLGISGACTAIQNFIGDMKAKSLMILQNMINGAIRLINDFIRKINSLGIIEIDTINHVTFGTEAALSNAVEKAARNLELANKTNEVKANIAARDDELDKAIADRDKTWDEYMAKNKALANEMSDVIDAGMAAYNAAKNDEEDFDESSLEDKISKTPQADEAPELSSKGKKNIDKVGKVDKVGGTVDISSEELKRMREFYENDIIQEVRVSQITPQVNVTFGDVHETADADKLIRVIKTKVKEAINVSPDGVH